MMKEYFTTAFKVSFNSSFLPMEFEAKSFGKFILTQFNNVHDYCMTETTEARNMSDIKKRCQSTFADFHTMCI